MPRRAIRQSQVAATIPTDLNTYYTDMTFLVNLPAFRSTDWDFMEDSMSLNKLSHDQLLEFMRQPLVFLNDKENFKKVFNVSDADCERIAKLSKELRDQAPAANKG
jgi:hypothetical protein